MLIVSVQGCVILDLSTLAFPVILPQKFHDSMFFLQQTDRIMPPTFTKSLKRVDGNIGNDVSMDCRVSGSQPMTIAWFKDEQEITPGSKFLPEFKDNSATLQIVRLEKADSGVYKCRATNSAGFKETSGTLYVKGCA